jgi:hypothetical protein
MENNPPTSLVPLSLANFSRQTKRVRGGSLYFGEEPRGAEWSRVETRGDERRREETETRGILFFYIRSWAWDREKNQSIKDNNLY